MGKYVFLSIPTLGHVNPTLPVAQELVQRGEQVIYYLTEEFRSAVEATGATFRPYQSPMGQTPLPTRLTGKVRMNPGAIASQMINESRHVLPQVLEALRSEQPDVIVHDPMCLWGRIAVQVLHIPAILCHSSYVANEHFSLFKEFATNSLLIPPELLSQIQTGIDDLCTRYHVPPFGMRQLFSYAGSLNIVFLPRVFQPANETFDERFMFVGPSLHISQNTPSFPFERLSDQPLLYISLGTVFNRRPDFFQLCFQAFGGQPWQVVLSYGKGLDEAVLGQAPANFLLAPHVPQLEILQRASVFVTHGGMNSTMESLYYGVPLVAIPQMIEQEMTARRIVTLGLGAHLDEEDLTAELLRETVTRVQHDPEIARQLQTMQQAIRSIGGYRQAADAILNFAQKQMPIGRI